MNAATSLKEYVEIPMKELVESSTNPRKSFDAAALDELAASIRTKGVLSPLLVRRINGHFEIVTGARRNRERPHRSSPNASSSWTSHNPPPMPSPLDTSVSSTPY